MTPHRRTKVLELPSNDDGAGCASELVNDSRLIPVPWHPYRLVLLTFSHSYLFNQSKLICEVTFPALPMSARHVIFRRCSITVDCVSSTREWYCYGTLYNNIA